MIIGVEVRLVVRFRTSFTPPEWAGLSFTLHHVLLIAHFVMNSVRLGPDLGTIPLAATEPGNSSSTSDCVPVLVLVLLPNPQPRPLQPVHSSHSDEFIARSESTLCIYLLLGR